jgi:hypothetical protein
MILKTTHRGIIDFLNAASLYLSTHQDETKLTYALNRVVKRASKIHGKYLERREELQIDNCVTDDKGKILRDADKGFQFTRDGLKKVNEECRRILDEEVEIDPYHATELPENLTQVERDAFMGFVIEGQREE